MLTRALWAEALKLKRTLALWLAVIAPLGIVGLQSLVVYQRRETYFAQAGSVWSRFGQETFFFSSLIMFPLFIALQGALLAGLEHGNDQWKHLYVLPLPRWTVYVAKQVVAMALLGLSIGLLVIFTVLAGLALQPLNPGGGFVAEIPWARLVKFAAGAYLSSWLMISIHTWVGLRWPSFVLAMTVGILATILALIIGGSALAQVYPWALPSIVSAEFASDAVAWLPIVWGALGGVAVAVWGCRDVTRREIL